MRGICALFGPLLLAVAALASVASASVYRVQGTVYLETANCTGTGLKETIDVPNYSSSACLPLGNTGFYFSISPSPYETFYMLFNDASCSGDKVYYYWSDPGSTFCTGLPDHQSSIVLKVSLADPTEFPGGEVYGVSGASTNHALNGNIYNGVDCSSTAAASIELHWISGADVCFRSSSYVLLASFDPTTRALTSLKAYTGAPDKRECTGLEIPLTMGSAGCYISTHSDFPMAVTIQATTETLPPTQAPTQPPTAPPSPTPTIVTPTQTFTVSATYKVDGNCNTVFCCCLQDQVVLGRGALDADIHIMGPVKGQCDSTTTVDLRGTESEPDESKPEVLSLYFMNHPYTLTNTAGDGSAFHFDAKDRPECASHLTAYQGSIGARPGEGGIDSPTDTPSPDGENSGSPPAWVVILILVSVLAGISACFVIFFFTVLKKRKFGANVAPIEQLEYATLENTPAEDEEEERL